jgi:D-alanine-D-alanine ligase
MKVVGIFCGGFSSEFEISLKSAQTIQDHFPKNYQTVKITVSKTGWNALIDGQEYPFDLNTMTFSNGQHIRIDLAIVYVHGDPGENGKIQALLDLHEIPYLNSGNLASALSFDKWYCNQFLKGFDIPVAKSLLLTKINDCTSEEIIVNLGLPCFVKPSDSGSSYGISKVNTQEELQPALEKAFAEGRTVVIESFLKGTEVTCGVYNSEAGIQTLPITEIVSENDFFDFEAKYLGKSEEIIPARISEIEVNRVNALSIKIYQLLKLRSIARIDFMLVDQIPHVIEVNTTPGFSEASIVPRMLAYQGKSIKEFWGDILQKEL